MPAAGVTRLRHHDLICLGPCASMVHHCRVQLDTAKDDPSWADCEKLLLELLNAEPYSPMYGTPYVP